MSPDTLILGCWSEVLAWLRRLIDVDGSARTHKAFQRAREVRSAGDLLRLAMVWSVCGLSLRSTCAWAAVSGVAALSDASLVERLSRAADWLGFLVKAALEAPALLNLKQCCVDVRAFEIRILASSIEKQFVLDAFMQI